MKLVALVTAVWAGVGVVLGSQTALGLSMQGTPVVVSESIRTSLVNNLPWIPATLLAAWLAVRAPLRRSTWRWAVPLHLVAIPAVSWLANLGVVGGFWWMAGRFDGPIALARQAAFWGTLRLHVAALVYLTTVGAAEAWLYWRDARARELRLARIETQLSQARFRALNAQIRPHFLFNTLHTIGQLWRSGRADEADEMLDHLGALFQRVRSSTERLEIPLAEELSMVGDYLAIEQARFPDRLTATVEASEAARSAAVPPLLLQPLVENAIRHGVSASADAGRVEVVASTSDGRLRVDVSDDGCGFGNGTNGGTGTGLTNTRERLRHAYGDSATLHILQPTSGGTTVRIELPLRGGEHGG